MPCTDGELGVAVLSLINQSFFSMAPLEAAIIVKK